MGGRGQFKVMSDNGWGEFGGYMNAKIQKLENQFQEESFKTKQLSTIFKNVAILVNGYTIPTCDQLKVLMAQHGGKFHNYYSSSSTTHIIASNLAYAKIKGLKPNQIVVYPQWITDSIKEGKLLPVHSYLIAAHGMIKNQETLEKFMKPSSSKGAVDNNTCSKSECSTKEHCVATTSNSNNSTSRILPTSNSAFLSEFYSHSRLHFLSTLKAELIDYVRTVTESIDHTLKGKQELLKINPVDGNVYELQSGETHIAHIDMDCFFVSVGLLSRPHLREKPIAVTHHQANTPSINLRRPGVDEEYERNFYKKKNVLFGDSSVTKQPNPRANHDPTMSKYVPSYSEIASCNYKAREAGLKNGMFYGKAKELCPDLVAIPYDFDAYRQTSQALYDVLTSYTKNIEAVSCDEALLDITDLVATTRLSPPFVVKHIRDRIKEKTGCDASAGIGPNIVVARMATRIGKPNGQHQVLSSQVLAFIRDRPVKNLPGVGSATANRLQELNASTCGELQCVSLDILKKEFGAKTGKKLRNFSLGIDSRKVCSSKERKSVSADVNYGIRLSTEDELNVFLSNLSKEVSERLKKARLRGKKITLKVMVRKPDAPIETVKFGGCGVCDTVSRSRTADVYTDDCDVIKTEVARLRKTMQIKVGDLRGIGIQVAQLNPIGKPDSSTKTTITSYVRQLKKPSIPDQLINTESTCQKYDEFSKVSNDFRFSNATSTPIASKTPRSPQCEISSSFLEALPKDLQQEVKKDWKAHKDLLQGNKRPVDHPRSRHSPAKQKSPSKTNSRLKKSPVKKKRGLLKPTTGNGSPNKRITDMFPIISKSSEDTTSKSDDSEKSEAEKPAILDPSTSPPPSPPSLGGAVTIQDSRDAVRQWTKTFLISEPEPDDVNEVLKYLFWLVVDTHDMEGACLVVNTLRRSILNLINNLDVVDTQINVDASVKSWITLYNRIASNLKELVKDLYDGATLNIKFLE